MKTRENLKDVLRPRIDELRRLRDEIRLDLRLATMDVRDEWQKLEGRLGDPGGAALELKDATVEAVERLTGELRKFKNQLRDRVDTSHVGGVMSRDVASCRPEDTVASAVATMWGRDVGFLPVTDASGGPVGVITDRDAAIAAATRGLRMDDMRVDSVMAKDPVVCSPDDGLDHALELMRERRIRRLMVVEDGRLSGIVTLADILRSLKESDGRMGKSAEANELLATLAAITIPGAAKPARAT